ncbi:hypothetical protein [Halobacillus litoralis]|uniref:DNA topoisomerase III n=1 Tax=Halobacillus litoralis TaxID=45668 RepID=A0A410MJ60_9BACI|nr:hypothetical protein [Halobacillus litoralis]QAS54730.1 hypothetical protein HLI_20955 [Halobacillus litoralis]
MERYSTIICEKPDQAKKIAGPFPHKQHKGTIEIKPCETFPKGAIVVHAIGHLCEMASPGDYHEDWSESRDWSLNNLPMLPEQFKIKVTRSKAKAFQTIKKHVMDPKVEQIIAASDAHAKES